MFSIFLKVSINLREIDQTDFLKKKLTELTLRSKKITIYKYLIDKNLNWDEHDMRKFSHWEHPEKIKE